jgi:hypothetical protein
MLYRKYWGIFFRLSDNIPTRDFGIDTNMDHCSSLSMGKTRSEMAVEIKLRPLFLGHICAIMISSRVPVLVSTRVQLSDYFQTLVQ